MQPANAFVPSYQEGDVESSAAAVVGSDSRSRRPGAHWSDLLLRGSAVLLIVSIAVATGWDRWRLARRARLDLRVPPLR